MKLLRAVSMRRAILGLCLLMSVFSTSIQGASDSASRSHHRIGLYLGIIDPLPTIFGFNLGFNAAGFLRLHGGYGTISVSSTGGTLSISTLGAGANLFIPKWNFSPTLGLSWAKVTVTGSATAGTNSYGFSASGSHLYTSIGFDWQTMVGFLLGFGYNVSLQSGVGGAPYLNIGWFF